MDALRPAFFVLWVVSTFCVAYLAADAHGGLWALVIGALWGAGAFVAWEVIELRAGRRPPP